MIIKHDKKKTGEILINRKENCFVQIDNSVFKDQRLSFKAKGILGYLLSKPNNWIVQIEDLYGNSTDGYTSIRSGLNELLITGYMELRNKFNSETKHFTGRQYVVHEDPLFKEGFRKLENKNKNFQKEEILLNKNPLLKERFIQK